MQLITNGYENSLEYNYPIASTQDCDWEINPFLDYRRPNEANPQNIQPLLSAAWDRRGITVSTGGERSFFHLIFSDHNNCQGIVIRDINPKIIGYAHFNILLLRIASDIDDYVRLSSSKLAIEEIKERVSVSTIPDKFSAFYLKHFDSLAKCYYGHWSFWKSDEDFESVYYHQNSRQFQILQTYAKDGNILPTLGDIGDLKFLDSHEVVIIDTSNIHLYSIIDIHCANKLEPPTVIWTSLNDSYTKFFSKKLRGLSPIEKEEMNQYLDHLASISGEAVDPMDLGDQLGSLVDYSQETLTFLRATYTK